MKFYIDYKQKRIKNYHVKVNESFSFECQDKNKNVTITTKSTSANITTIRKNYIILTDVIDEPKEIKYDCRIWGTKYMLYDFKKCALDQLTIKNFHCYSNLINLNCTFDEDYPCSEKIDLSYRLTYRPSTSIEHGLCNRKRESNATPAINCLKRKLQGSYTCEIPNIESDLYYFDLFIQNDYLANNYTYEINIYEVLDPHPPEKIKFKNVTSNGAVVQWKLSQDYLKCSDKLLFNIIVESPYGQESNQTLFNLRKLRLFQSLKYPYTVYKFKIRIKSKWGNAWSTYSSNSVRTAAARPAAAPRTSVGGFYLSDDIPNYPDVYIYYKSVFNYERNGPNISYVITNIKENEENRNQQVTLWPLLVLFVMLNQVHGFGWIEPTSPILKAVNDSFDVFCSINTNYSSSELLFYEGDNLIPSTIINKTTIKIHIANPKMMETRYTCKLNMTNDLKGVDEVDVRVGLPPGDVTDFKCRSSNWQNMTCKFKQMVNTIPTTYNLNYYPIQHFNLFYNCPLHANMDQSYSCFMDSYNKYRPSYENYTFHIMANNTFGSHNQNIEINNFASVIPDQPAEISTDNITSKSVNISWNVSFQLFEFPKNFIHQLNYTSQYEKGVWKTVTLKIKGKNHKNGFKHFLNNLEYAHAWYDIRIRMRCEISEDIDEMWSNYTSKTFRTAARTPDEPPKIDIGAFQINYNDIYVYWIELPEWKRNGDGSEYVISEIGRHSRVRADTITNTMARFRGLDDIDDEYRFLIKSKNVMGESAKGSIVRIPRRSERIGEPTNLKKVLHNGKYILSWRAPRRENIINYTVFWCEGKSELPNDCVSSINFATVDNLTTQFEHESNKTVNFAVSANTHNSSSGMVWFSCTAANSNDIGKLKNFWIVSMHSKSMEIKWKPDCTDSSIVEGYNIKYCPISSPKTLDCKDPEKSFNITGKTDYIIDNLHPYTTYKTIISMYSKTRMGPPSEALVNATHEDVPTPPRNLVVRDVKNSSLWLYWDAPEHANGVLMYYEIAYNTHKIRVNNDKREDTEIVYQLTNLSSFTNYKIVVAACTIKCSNASNSVTVQTSIGVPGVISQPSTIKSNNSRIQIAWSEPSIVAGNIEYYEMRTVIHKNDVKIYDHIAQVASNYKSCQLKHVICQNDSAKYDFYLRAVNVVPSLHALSPKENITNAVYHKRSDEPIQCVEEHDIATYMNTFDPYAEHLPGQWSKPLTHWCNYTKHQFSFIYPFLILGSIIVFVLIYLSVNKIKIMKDITVILPDGLEDVTVKELSKNIEIMMSSNNKNEQIIICDKATAAQMKYSKVKDEQEQSLLKNRGTSSCSTASTSSTCSDSVENHQPSHTNSLNIRDYPCDNINDDETVSVNSLSNDSDINYQKSSPKPFLVHPGTGEIQTSKPILIRDEPHTVPLSISQNPTNITPNFALSSNGYVTAPVMRPTTNSYVPPSMFNRSPPQAAGNNGYTQVNAFGKPIMNAAHSDQADNKLKTSIVASTDANGICGYVTHKQLSDFGHRMQ